VTLQFKPALPAEGTVLCLGAHCDDIEIGCGGTLVELRRRHPGLRFAWVVFSGDAVRERETRAAAAALLGTGRNVKVDVQRFRPSYFPHLGSQIKDEFEALRARVAPDLVMTHYLSDRHQDHRVIAELTWNTLQPRDSGIRDPQVRGRPRPSRGLLPAVARDGRSQDRRAAKMLSVPVQPPMVRC